MAAPALAQPAQTDDMASFDKDLDALFVGNGLTADQAATRAQQTSPTVRRRAAEVDAAIATAEQAELARVPVLQTKASFTRLSPVPGITFPNPMGGVTVFNIPENSYDLTATAVIPLSDYVVRYPKLIEAAREAETVANQSKLAAQVSASEDARLAYYEWVRAKLQVLIAKRQLIQVQSSLERIQALTDAQRLTKADLFRVESQEAEAEQVVDQLTNLATLREEQLRLQIGASETEPLAIGEDIRKDIAAPATAGQLDDMMNHAVSRRPDIRTLDAGIIAKEEQRAAEKTNEYPRLSAFGTADEARPNQRIFPLTDEFRFTWSVGVQLTWTLGDALVSGTNVKRIAAETSELREDRENLVRGTRIEVLAAQQAVQLAQHSLATTQKGLVAAEESYRVRRELLAADRVTVVELIDTETDLTRARIAALNARVDLRVALTQLSHALGDDVTAR